MTSSGVASFNPGIGDLVLYAYSLCGIRRPALTQEHLVDARLAANLMLAAWNNETPNLWKVDLVEVSLVQGTETYSVDPSTIMILDAYVRITDANGNPIDRIIWPISRTEYASLPDKQQQGAVTSFWFDRLLSPSITLWQVPDGNGPYTLRYYRCSQIFDASLQGGQTLDLPNRWLDAFAYGLAARLAVSYAPKQLPLLQPMADKAYLQAAEQDTENTPMYFGIMSSSYYVR